jgi:hypothetical protein
LFSQEFLVDGVGFGEQGSGPLLDGAGFDAAGPDGQEQLSDGTRHDGLAGVKPSARGMAKIFFKGIEYLQRGFEAQLSRQQAG